MVDKKIDEKNLWQWLSRVEPYYGNDLHMERIENIAGKGTPDVHGCLFGTHFTIELKAIDRTELLDCGVSEHQEFWALRRRNAGGNHWFLIQVGRGYNAKRYLVRGLWAPELRKKISEDCLRHMAYHNRDVRFPEEVIETMRGHA